MFSLLLKDFISDFYLTLTWSQSPKRGFLVTWHNYHLLETLTTDLRLCFLKSDRAYISLYYEFCFSLLSVYIHVQRKCLLYYMDHFVFIVLFFVFFPSVLTYTSTCLLRKIVFQSFSYITQAPLPQYLHSFQFTRSLQTTCIQNSKPYLKWAASWQNQQNDCAPSEDSDPCFL